MDSYITVHQHLDYLTAEVSSNLNRITLTIRQHEDRIQDLDFTPEEAVRIGKLLQEAGSKIQSRPPQV